MKIIISPAKKMREVDDFFRECSKPAFLDNANELCKKISSFSVSELKSLFKCNDQIANLNYNRYQNMDFSRAVSPAILSYDGITFKYMSPMVFENANFEYVQSHLLILSALYGALKPLDSVVMYRLEMQAKLQVGEKSNLYDYWGSKIYDEFLYGDNVIIDLASAEYSRAVKKFASKNQLWVSVVFGEFVGDKVVEKGVYVKMARGEMVAYMAENDIKDPVQIKNFDRLGYRFCSDLSTKTKYVFIKNNNKSI